MMLYGLKVKLMEVENHRFWAAECAKKQGISLNQYVNNAILAANTAKTFANEDPNALAAAYPTHFAACREKRQTK